MAKYVNRAKEIIKRRTQLPLNVEAPSDDDHGNTLINRSVSTIRGDLLKQLDELQNNEVISAVSVSPINKLFRAKILLGRELSYFEQEPQQVVVESRASTSIKKLSRISPVETARKTSPLTKDEGHPSSDATTIYLKPSKRKDADTLVDGTTVDKKARTNKKVQDNNIHIVNISSTPYTRLTVQGMPTEIDCNPEPSWSVIRSIGRNNPFYVYTGSEDTISFDISWYSNNGDNREDVITKCKLLESWTKADAYNAPPPLLQIIWGKSGIFEGQTFILHSAKYKLGNFQNSFRHSRDGEVKDAKLLPNLATQSLVFKKVTQNNTLTADIVNKDTVASTPGITQ